jgi:DNA-binding NarL/FixJ family response regulator
VPFRTRPIVLIAEDEANVAMPCADVVIDTGASVAGPFSSCEAAVEWLSINSPDVAIIDVTLQDGNSAQLAKKLCGREIPFVVVSGSSADSVGIDEIFKSGPRLEKPLASEVLESALRTMLAPEPNI